MATSVLPSPVFISAMRPWCSTTPPSTCTREGAHTQYPVSCLPADGEGIGQNVVQRLAGSKPCFQSRRLLLQLPVGHRFIFVFQGERTRLTIRTNIFQFSLGISSKNFLQKAPWRSFNSLSRWQKPLSKPKTGYCFIVSLSMRICQTSWLVFVNFFVNFPTRKRFDWPCS